MSRHDRRSLRLENADECCASAAWSNDSGRRQRLLETYEQHLAAGAGDNEAARAALAEFGNLALVVGEFIRHAPGRRTAALLLASGPLAGSCWAAALIVGHAWIWLVSAAIRLSFGAALLLAVAALAAAATSRHSYRRTRLAALAARVILAVDNRSP